MSRRALSVLMSHAPLLRSDIPLGFVYQGIFQFHFATQRFPSVLARIGLAWAIAAILYMFNKSRKTQWGIAAGILVGYFLLLKFVRPLTPPPEPTFSD